MRTSNQLPLFLPRALCDAPLVLHTSSRFLHLIVFIKNNFKVVKVIVQLPYPGVDKSFPSSFGPGVENIGGVLEKLERGASGCRIS